MGLSNDMIDSFLFCKYKAYLKMTGNYGDKTDYELVESELCKRYKEQFLINIRLSYESEQIIYPPSLLEVNFRRSQSMLINPEVKGDRFLISFDAIQISHPKNTREKASYIPIMITPKEKLTKNDKISLTVRTILLNRIVHQFPETGRIIFGKKLKMSSIRMKDYRRTAQKMLDDLTALMTENAKPLIIRCDNCRICEFEENCMRYLIERDDLSLMGRLSAIEIAKKNKKGIFTINQLSYNFRPKRFKKIRAGGRPFSPELKALAIRDKKTYILDTPHEIKSGRTEIYLDFEGLPDEKFIYLIGLIIKDNDSEKKVSLWADSEENERKIFQNFVTTISGYKDSVIYHYGSYETGELKRAMKLYPEIHSALAEILDRTINLLSLFYSSIYPPTYTNELKEIGRFLGFDWTDKHSSGIQSIAWRKKWELTGDEVTRTKLIDYNIEDCLCLKLAHNWVETLLIRDGDNTNNLATVDDPKEPAYYPYSLGRPNYLIPEFREINEFVYFDYQRTKIYLKTNNSVRKAIKRTIKRTKSVNKIDRTVHIYPERCPFCSNKKHLEKKRTSNRLMIDLRFIKYGIRKFIVNFVGGGFRCSRCKKLFTPESYKKLPYYGNDLMVWTINQHIQYRVTYEQLVDMISGLFKIQVSLTRLSMFEEKLAQRYSETYEEIKMLIINGSLISVDETKARIVGLSSGYVWVFTNHDTVLFLFMPTREATFLQEFLKDFKGVLISDFYAGYDSLYCRQQKCLIHLIRDLNKDLVENQLDPEFKTIILSFGRMLRSVMETINRYGLKKRHLNKHKEDVERFYNLTLNQEFKSEMALKCKKRFIKNRDKLFTFLEYDDIPWNNSNAENAIKAFANYRKVADGRMRVKGLKDHLILLSILQTCKYRGIDFLEFLKSGERSISSYADQHCRFR